MAQMPEKISLCSFRMLVNMRRLSHLKTSQGNDSERIKFTISDISSHWYYPTDDEAVRTTSSRGMISVIHSRSHIRTLSLSLSLSLQACDALPEARRTRRSRGGVCCRQCVLMAIEGTSKPTFIPDVQEDLKPTVGKLFTSVEEAYTYYNNYARSAGFSVRYSSCKYGKDKELTWKMFVCSKEGKTDERVKKKSGEVKRRRIETREGCLACMTIKKEKDGPNYFIQKFVEGHSHVLATPSKKHLLKSHRGILSAKKKLTDTFACADKSTSQQIAVFDMESKGSKNIGCSEWDVRNCEKDRKLERRGHDAKLLLEHLKEMKELNPLFLYSLKEDEKKRMTHCFWIDPIARSSYNYFGDVIVFDTSYGTNKYQFIFASFSGVNHHGQLINLGCGFIQDESTGSFIWLFERWLEAMSGSPPKAIITDQDPAITNAIRSVLANTFHRFCIWNILQKVPEKLGVVASRETFKEPFKECIWNSYDAEQFEGSWKKLITENGLENHSWLESLYEIRCNWVPAYFKHLFFAGISNTQGRKNMNAFKNFASKRNSFIDFIVQFDREVGRQRQKELIADHESKNSKLEFKTPHGIERQMAEIYTRHNFFQFQEELFQSENYIAKLHEKDEVKYIYKVGKLEEIGYEQEVIFEPSTQHAACTCFKFEFDGIPCRHILCILRQARIAHLPEHYILKRWTQSAKVGISDKMGNEIERDANESMSSRHKELSYIVKTLIDMGSTSQEAYDIVKSGFCDLAEQVRQLQTGKGAVEGVKSKHTNKTIPDRTIEEPDCAKSNVTGRWLQSEREEMIKENQKDRLSNGCEEFGISYENTVCLALHSRIAQPSMEQLATEGSNAAGSLDKYDDKQQL